MGFSSNSKVYSRKKNITTRGMRVTRRDIYV